MRWQSGWEGDPMETPQTYRLQAELCARYAERAKTPQHRASLLEMAQTWLRLADWVAAKRAAVEQAT
jgi:hypothetical protein